jgi:hypothetical protein
MCIISDLLLSNVFTYQAHLTATNAAMSLDCLVQWFSTFFLLPAPLTWRYDFLQIPKHVAVDFSVTLNRFKEDGFQCGFFEGNMSSMRVKNDLNRSGKTQKRKKMELAGTPCVLGDCTFTKVFENGIK